MVPSLLRQYAKTCLASMLRCMDAARHHDILGAVAGSSPPLLVIRGKHDAIADAAWIARVATAGRGTARTIPGGGHMVVWTHGRLVAQAVREALVTWPRGSAPTHQVLAWKDDRP